MNKLDLARLVGLRHSIILRAVSRIKQWWFRLRGNPVNDTDVITLCPHEPLGPSSVFVMSPIGHLYQFDARTLMSAMFASGKFENPYTREVFSQSCIDAISRASGPQRLQLYRYCVLTTDVSEGLQALISDVRDSDIQDVAHGDAVDDAMQRALSSISERAFNFQSLESCEVRRSICDSFHAVYRMAEELITTDHMARYRDVKARIVNHFDSFRCLLDPDSAMSMIVHRVGETVLRQLAEAEHLRAQGNYPYVHLHEYHVLRTLVSSGFIFDSSVDAWVKPSFSARYTCAPPPVIVAVPSILTDHSVLG